MWFSALVSMATQLSQKGFIPYICNMVVHGVSALGFESWLPSFMIVTLIYFYSHYLFASGTAHIGKMLWRKSMRVSAHDRTRQCVALH